MFTPLPQCVEDTRRRPYLFVYGTLRRGMGANDMMREGFEPGGFARLDDFTMMVSGIPFIFPATGKHVVGEVYRILDPARLQRVDQYEGYSYYRGEIEPLVTGEIPVDETDMEADDRGGDVPEGTRVRAWAYIARDSRERDLTLEIRRGWAREASDYRVACEADQARWKGY